MLPYPSPHAHTLDRLMIALHLDIPDAPAGQKIEMLLEKLADKASFLGEDILKRTELFYELCRFIPSFILHFTTDNAYNSLLHVIYILKSDPDQMKRIPTQVIKFLLEIIVKLKKGETPEQITTLLNLMLEFHQQYNLNLDSSFTENLFEHFYAQRDKASLPEIINCLAAIASLNNIDKIKMLDKRKLVDLFAQLSGIGLSPLHQQQINTAKILLINSGKLDPTSLVTPQRQIVAETKVPKKEIKKNLHTKQTPAQPKKPEHKAQPFVLRDKPQIKKSPRSPSYYYFNIDRNPSLDNLIALANYIKAFTGQPVMLGGSAVPDLYLRKEHLSDWDFRAFGDHCNPQDLAAHLSKFPGVSHCRIIQGAHQSVIRFNFKDGDRIREIEVALWEKKPEESLHTAMMQHLQHGDTNLSSTYTPLTEGSTNNKMEIIGYSEYCLISLLDQMIDTIKDPEETFKEDPIRILRLLKSSMEYPTFALHSRVRLALSLENMRAWFRPYLTTLDLKEKNQHQGRLATTLKSLFFRDLPNRTKFSDVVATMANWGVLEAITDMPCTDKIEKTLYLLTEYNNIRDPENALDADDQFHMFNAFLAAHYSLSNPDKNIYDWQYYGTAFCLGSKNETMMHLFIDKLKNKDIQTGLLELFSVSILPPNKVTKKDIKKILFLETLIKVIPESYAAPAALSEPKRPQIPVPVVMRMPESTSTRRRAAAVAMRMVMPAQEPMPTKVPMPFFQQQRQVATEFPPVKAPIQSEKPVPTVSGNAALLQRQQQGKRF